MKDCNSIAFWRYSLPISITTSGAIYAAIKAGLLNTSKINTTFPRLPKMLVGGILGYIGGQWAYVYSRDCTRRFTEFAPEGEIAQRLRGDYVCKDCQAVADEAENTAEEASDGYVIPSDSTEEVEKIIMEQIGQ